MKNSLKLFAGIAIAACLAFALPKDYSKEITVLIDAGHGGKDYGATYSTFTEKEIVNQIAAKVKEMNKDAEIKINFTRVSDEFISLEDRVKAINNLKPDLVLSLHLNYIKNTDAANGMEFFVAKEAKQAEKAAKYAKLLEQRFISNDYKSRGVKTAPFYILKKSEAPAISFQMGFLSNSSDRAYLTNAAKQEEIAGNILEFLKKIK